MVHPVGAVDSSVSLGGCASLKLRHCVQHWLTQSRAANPRWGRFPLLEGEGSRPYNAFFLLSSLHNNLRDSLQTQSISGRSISGQSNSLPNALQFISRFETDAFRPESWQPWSAEPPYAHQFTRWWPFEDWPPATPEVAVEDKIPDVLPDVIVWNERAGLLDLWA